MNRAQLLTMIIVSGWILSGIIAVMIIATIAYMSIFRVPIPAAITNFGGVIIGFFFGQFASIIKDALLPGANETKSNQTQERHTENGVQPN